MRKDLINKLNRILELKQEQELITISKEIIGSESLEQISIAASILAQNNRTDLAIKLNKKALSLNESYVPAIMTQGVIARMQNNFELARQSYIRALEIDPHCISAWHNLGVLSELQNKPENAIEYYKKVSEKYLASKFRIAICLQKQQLHQEAVKILESIKEQDPENLTILFALAQSQQQNNQMIAAQANFETVILHEPENLDAQHSLATIYTAKKQYDLAINSFIQIIKINPNHNEALHNLASIYYFQKQYKKALDCWLKQLVSKPDAHTNYNIGCCYLALQKHDEAEPYLKAACNDRPNSTEPIINLASIFIKLQNWNKVIKLYQRALEIEPENQEVQYVLAAIQQTENSFSKPPKQYVKHLFDQYADNFEHHLLDNLKYCAHKIIKDNLAENINPNRKYIIADLGCGTGLCGVECKQFSEKLIGIDLSSAMLEKAKARKIYDSLHEQDIEEFLTNSNKLDIIIAADVMPYIGDLDLILERAFLALNDQGIFIFTIETTYKEQEFHLSESGRYQHNAEIICTKAEKLKWTIVDTKNVVTRTQNFQPVTSCLFILKKVL